jgi:hypothetical protein
MSLPTRVAYAHGLIETARGMCTDELDYRAIDVQLAHASDAVRAIEHERDRAIETRENANTVSVRVELENTRLRRDLANAEHVLRELAPFVPFIAKYNRELATMVRAQQTNLANTLSVIQGSDRAGTLPSAPTTETLAANQDQGGTSC